MNVDWTGRLWLRPLVGKLMFMSFFLLLSFRPPPRCDLHWPSLWLHQWLHLAALLCRLWQVVQRWVHALHWLIARLDCCVIAPVKPSSFNPRFRRRGGLQLTAVWLQSAGVNNVADFLTTESENRHIAAAPHNRRISAMWNMKRSAACTAWVCHVSLLGGITDFHNPMIPFQVSSHHSDYFLLSPHVKIKDQRSGGCQWGWPCCWVQTVLLCFVTSPCVQPPNNIWRYQKSVFVCLGWSVSSHSRQRGKVSAVIPDLQTWMTSCRPHSHSNRFYLGECPFTPSDLLLLAFVQQQQQQHSAHWVFTAALLPGSTFEQTTKSLKSQLNIQA